MIWLNILTTVNWYVQLVGILVTIRRLRRAMGPRFTIAHFGSQEYMQRLIYHSDLTCYEQLRMNRAAFVQLCMWHASCHWPTNSHEISTSR